VERSQHAGRHVSGSGSGIWSSDRSSKGTWSAPTLVVPGVIFSGSALMIDAASDAVGDLTLAVSIGSEVAVAAGNITGNS